MIVQHFLRNPTINLMLFPVLLLLLSACGSGDNFTKGGNPRDTETEILSFEVIGNESGVDGEIINTKLTTDRTFEISWEVYTSFNYTYHLYIDVSDQFNPVSALWVTGGVCGTQGDRRICLTQEEGSLSCELTADRQLQCSGMEQAQDVSAKVFNGVNVYFHLVISNEVDESTDITTSAAVNVLL